MGGDEEEEEEVEDVFESGLALVFDYPPVAHGDPARPVSIPVRVGSQQLDLVFELADGGDAGLQARHVWDASLYLLSILIPPSAPSATSTASDVTSLKGKTVVELGAGAGLGSVAAWLAGADSVLATDFPDEDILSTLLHNLDANSSPRQGAGGGGGRRRGVLGHEWGAPVDVLVRWNGGERFDVVLALDLVWRSSSHPALIDSILSLLEPQDGRAILVSGLHSGRPVVDLFLDGLEKRGASVVRRWEVKRRMQGWEGHVPKAGDGDEEETRGVLVCFEVCIAA